MKTDLMRWEDLNEFLDETGNSIIVQHEDLIRLINSDELILTNKKGKRFWLGQYILQKPNLRIGACWVDSGKDNYGENTKEVILPL